MTKPPTKESACPDCGKPLHADHIHTCSPQVKESAPDADRDAFHKWLYTMTKTSHLTIWDAWQAALLHARKVPDELRSIGSLIATQDNRITDAPIFIVQQKRSYVTDPENNDARFEWRETESGEYIEAEPEEAEKLERRWKESGYEEPEGWKRYAMFDVWEFVTACFTEQGCKDYLAINGHNLKEPRIYAEGSYRNNEYRTVRNFLLSPQAAPQPGEGTPQFRHLVADELTPEIMKKIQTQTEIGAYICANWSGAYDCLQELYKVMIGAQKTGEGESAHRKE